MKKPYLNTSASVTPELRELSAPARLRVPLHEKHKPTVKKKQTVARGEVIAENPAKSAYGTGFLHAGMDGVVEEILTDSIVIAALPEPRDGEETTVPAGPEPAALDGLEGEDLCRRLLELGIDTSVFHPGRMLIVNGLNPEPGMLASEYLLLKERATLGAGLRLLERAVRPPAVKLAVARGVDAALQGCVTVHVSDRYPATIDPLVVHALTGAERPGNVDVISVSHLYRAGRVAETGLPAPDAILSLNDCLFRVPAGTPVRDVLDAAGISSGPGWKVALGGPMRGESIFDLSVGVPPDCTAITVVREGEFPEVAPNSCIHCGECVLACPARIHPGLLSANAEFGFFDAARAGHVEACLECGMCTFVCPANRPVMQYLLVAKRQLADQDETLTSCRLQA